MGNSEYVVVVGLFGELTSVVSGELRISEI